VTGILVLLSSAYARATVYEWKGEGGVLHLSNDLEVIPEAQRASAQQYTSKLAGVTVPVSTESPPPAAREMTPVDVQLNAYQRGLEQGLQTAERQVTLAGELARTVLEAAPRTPPVRIVVQQPGPVVIRDVSPAYYTPAYYAPFYGFGGPYGYYDFPLWSACAPSPRFSFNYSFRCSRFIPHSHFFPGVRGPRTGFFFPSGHFSHHGFLSGPAFVVR
jgi:hypothetical protein